MKLAGRSLSVLTPMYGGACTGTYHQSMVRLMMSIRDVGMQANEINTYNESLIQRARNRLADEYLKNCEHERAIFIDSDIGFEPEDILAMMELDLDIIGAPCVKKSIRWNTIREAIQKHGDKLSTDDLARIGGDFVVNWIPFQGQRQIHLDQPQEVESLGTGMLMIKREVFIKIREAFPDRWYTNKGDPMALPGKIFDFFPTGIDPETRVYNSEDYGFCHLARSLGFKIWLCPWVKTTHMGSYIFKGDMPATATLTGKV